MPDEVLRQRLVHQCRLGPLPQHLINPGRLMFFRVQGRTLREEQAMDRKFDRCGGPAMPVEMQCWGPAPADFLHFPPKKAQTKTDRTGAYRSKEGGQRLKRSGGGLRLPALGRGWSKVNEGGLVARFFLVFLLPFTCVV